MVIISHIESGLERAESISAALYKGSVDALASLSPADIKQSFAGATVCDILQEPGMTMLDLALKAKCFPTERKNRISIQMYIKPNLSLNYFPQVTQLASLPPVDFR